MTKRTHADKPASLTSKKSKNKTARPASRRRSSGLQYESLEQRLPLDASFSFDGTVLEINGFNEETQLTVILNDDGLTATIDGQNFIGDPVGGLEFPNMEEPDDEEPPELGNVLRGMVVPELVINSTGFGAATTNVVINVQGDESLDTLAIDVTGNITVNSNGNEFDLFETTLITDGDLIQSDNRGGGRALNQFGNLGFRVGGDASFNDLGADQLGGEVGGNLNIESDIGDLIINNQFDLNFSGNNGNGADGLFVGGDATIRAGTGDIGQTLGSPIVINGRLDISALAVNFEDPDTGEEIITTLEFIDPDNDFNTVNIVSRSSLDIDSVLVFDRDNFTVQNASSETITHLAAGRANEGSPVRSPMTGIMSTFGGSLTLSGIDVVNEDGEVTNTSGTSIQSANVVLQASGGVTQDNSNRIVVDLLQLGGVEISEGSGDFVFNGTLEGTAPENPGALEEFAFTARVRGNLDFTTTSEVTLVSEPVSYPPDAVDDETGEETGRPDELFEDSWVDGDARINANRIDFDVSFETTKFVLAVEADVMQEVGTSLITDQLYILGKEIDLNNDTNDTNQLAVRAFGDESFLRYSDVGTFRIVNLDGSIEGDTGALPQTTRVIPETIIGLSTERFPDIGIGEESFIEITTGLGGAVDNPRVGIPPVELDDVETFEVIRDDTRAQFESDEFGEDGRGVFFVEFIYDGVSPFDFVAQSVDDTGRPSDAFDPELALYDEFGNLVAESDDPSQSLNATISNEDIAFSLPAGRYYLASAAFSATFGDNFEVQTEFDDGVPEQPTGTLLITLESLIPDLEEPEPPEVVLDRLESFIAPEVRRSFFQDADAPIDTEKLFVSAREDGSVNFTSPQNLIDSLCIFETDDFVLESTTSITIDAINADGDVLLTAPEFITVNNLFAEGNVEFITPGRVLGQNINTVGNFNVTGDFVNLEDVTSASDASIAANDTAVLTEFDVAGSIVAVSGTDDIVVDGVRAQGEVNLAAADDIRLNNSNGVRRLEAESLILFAENINNDNLNGVFLFTDVDSISSNVGSGGDFFINELSEVDTDLVNDSGSISLRANGDITGTVSVTRPGHDVTLIAKGDDADISVESITVLGSNDNVRLFADDDITATVQGGNLQAQARNEVEDEEVSVRLETTVRTLNVSSGVMSDPNANAGDIVVNESNPLILSRAVNANGRITVSAEGSITTGNVQSNRVSSGNAININANGSGSDLTTARIVVRDGTAGVLLTAGDDIVDGNVNDRLAVVADRVRYEAGNNTADSFNGVIGHSFADTISVSISSNAEAGAFLFNTGNATIADTVISNGQFSLTNRSGAVRVDDISILSQSLSNRVFVKTSGIGGDVLVGDIDAGVNGIITIDSADDVFDTDLLDELFISGEVLNVTSRNNRIDSFDGIILNVDVETLFERALNGGESFIRRDA